MRINEQFSPQQAAKVVAVAELLGNFTDKDLVSARDKRNTAVMDLIANKPDLFKPIFDFKPSEDLAKSRMHVRELLDQALAKR